MKKLEDTLTHSCRSLHTNKIEQLSSGIFSDLSELTETRKRGPKFHVDEHVSIKIDPVDKISPLHPNV